MVRRKSIQEEKEVVVDSANKLLQLLRNSLFRRSDSARVYASDFHEDGIKKAFDEFAVYKHLEFPDISNTKLRAMTEIKVRFGKHERHSISRRLSWNHKSISRRLLHTLCFLFSCMAVFAKPFRLVFWTDSWEGLAMLVVFERVIFAIDLVANFVTTVLAPDGSFIYSHRVIAQKYLSSWFVVDLLAAAFPWFVQSVTDTNPTVQFALVVELCVIDAKFVRDALRLTWGGIVSPDESTFWYLVWNSACVVAFLQASTIVLYWCCPETPEPTWFDDAYGELSDDVFGKYTVFLHGTIQYILGDGIPKSTAERWYAMLMNVFGMFLTALIVGQVTHWIQQRTAKTTKWRMKIDAINESMAQMGISQDLADRIRNYYAFSWAVNGGEDRGHRWLKELSSSYHDQVCMQVNERLISSVPMFKQTSTEFLQALVTRLKQQLYLPGDYIIHHGDVGNEMYFVVRGTVQAMDKDETTVYTVLSQGAFFGEIALMKTSCLRTATVRSFTYSELNVLFKEDFDSILQHHPEVITLLEKEARLRERNSSNVKKLAEKQSRKTKTNIKTKKSDSQEDLDPSELPTFSTESKQSVFNTQLSKGKSYRNFLSQSSSVTSSGFAMEDVDEDSEDQWDVETLLMEKSTKQAVEIFSQLARRLGQRIADEKCESVAAELLQAVSLLQDTLTNVER